MLSPQYPAPEQQGPKLVALQVYLFWNPQLPSGLLKYGDNVAVGLDKLAVFV